MSCSTMYTQTSIYRTSPLDPFCSLYRIIQFIKCNMLSKSSKWELSFVHYISKFTILRFVISRFECTICLNIKSQNFCIEVAQNQTMQSNITLLNNSCDIFCNTDYNLCFFMNLLSQLLNRTKVLEEKIGTLKLILIIDK